MSPLTGVQDSLAIREIDEQDGERRLVHLNAVPIRGAVEPHVLRPVPVGLLSHMEIAQHAPDVFMRANRDEAPGRFHEVSWPHEVITAQIVVGLGEPPGDRKAGDDPAFDTLGFVRSHECGTDPIEPALVFRRYLAVEPCMPGVPASDIRALHVVEVLQQADQRVLTGFHGRRAETKGQDERAIRGREVDFSRNRDVPVLGARVDLIQPLVGMQVLPPVGDADESDGSGEPGSSARERQRRDQPRWPRIGHSRNGEACRNDDEHFPPPL